VSDYAKERAGAKLVASPEIRSVYGRIIGPHADASPEIRSVYGRIIGPHAGASPEIRSGCGRNLGPHADVIGRIGRCTLNSLRAYAKCEWMTAAFEGIGTVKNRILSGSRRMLSGRRVLSF
jgi:hypothetical protein